jgi:hypothetical protein
VHRVQVLFDGAVVRDEALVAPPEREGMLSLRLD